MEPMDPLYIHFPDALVIAAHDNDFEVVGKLLDGGVSPNIQDESWSHRITRCCQGGLEFYGRVASSARSQPERSGH
jgi:hypothetical protein